MVRGRRRSYRRAMAAAPPTSRLSRTGRFGGLVAGQGLRWATTQAANRVRSPERAEAATGERAAALARELVQQLGHMRGAAMKIGQVLSTVDFTAIPAGEREEFKRTLAALRDDVPPLPFSKIERLVKMELGGPLAQHFAEFDEDAFAAASIGQVHRAVTHDGDEVAVKVQYPGIAEAVESDMRNLRLLTPILRRLMPGLELKDLLAELAERVTEECDYELEAANHRRLARHWRRHPFVRVPAVDTDLSRRRVLVTEWVDGIGFERVAEQPDAVRDRYAEALYRFYYATAAELDIALGDPHPGNYLLCDDGRIAFFDFGMVRKLPRGYLRREGRVLAAIRDSDGPGLVNAMRELGYLPGLSAEWDASVLLDGMRRAGWWFLESGPRRLAPEDLWRNSEALRDGSGRQAYEQLRRMTLPVEALLLRRMEGLLFQIASTLRAEADWGALLSELVEGGDPTTELGREHAAWYGER